MQEEVHTPLNREASSIPSLSEENYDTKENR